MAHRVLSLLVALLVLAPVADEAAAATKPKPSRLASGQKIRVGPVLAGERAIWAQRGIPRTVFSADQRKRRHDLKLTGIEGFGRLLRIDELAASPTRMGYTIVEEQIEVRDGYSDHAFHFGTFTTKAFSSESLGFCEFANGACWWRGVGATRPRGIEVSEENVAWGPFHDGSDDPDADILLVRDHEDGSVSIVRGRRVGEFRLAGGYLAYRQIALPGSGSTDSIVVVKWRTGEVVRTIRETHPFVFDIDERGRVAAARRLPGAVTAFGVYDAAGRFKRFARRSFRDETRAGQIWIARDRVAYARTDTSGRRLWDVVTTGGRSLATMRAPAKAALTDFDGDCLAYRRARSQVYVASVGRVPKGSVCR